MKLYILTFFIFSNTSQADGQTCNTWNAKNYLNKVFKNKYLFLKRGYYFTGYDTSVKSISTPILNKLLPGFCFYSLHLYSNALEYMKVPTALALSKKGSGKSTFLHSPNFTRDSTSFFEIFYGIATSDTTQSVMLSKEIASIAASITYKGHVSRLYSFKEPQLISFELCENDGSLKIYDFNFDNKNTLQSITIKDGFSRQSPNDNYYRKEIL